MPRQLLESGPDGIRKLWASRAAARRCLHPVLVLRGPDKSYGCHDACIVLCLAHNNTTTKQILIFFLEKQGICCLIALGWSGKVFRVPEYLTLKITVVKYSYKNNSHYLASSHNLSSFLITYVHLPPPQHRQALHTSPRT